jgi:hypothetical protein
MNATTIDSDLTEDETLDLFTYEVSDEALEAAAEGGPVPESGCGVRSKGQSCYLSC